MYTSNKQNKYFNYTTKPYHESLNIICMNV